MKRTFLTALIIGALVCTAVAQDHKVVATSTDAPVAKEADKKADATKAAKEWQDLLNTELKLTDEQKQKIADMDKAFGERRQAIHNNPELSDETKKERKVALLKAREAQFLKLLTPEQQARYNELVAAKHK